MGEAQCLAVIGGDAHPWQVCAVDRGRVQIDPERTARDNLGHKDTRPMRAERAMGKTRKAAVELGTKKRPDLILADIQLADTRAAPTPRTGAILLVGI